jgi:hypothetical protein
MLISPHGARENLRTGNNRRMTVTFVTVIFMYIVIICSYTEDTRKESEKWN